MSYGVNNPWGLKPSSFLDGSLYTGQLSPYKIASGYATALYTNDPVTLLTNGVIGIGVPGSQIIGSFQGCRYYAADGTYTFSPYWTASLATQGAQYVEAFVADAPGLLYDMQVSTTGNGGAAPIPAPTIAQLDVNKNINFGVAAVTNFGGSNAWTTPTNAGAIAGQTAAAQAAPNNPGAGSTRTGQSGYFLDYSSIQTTSTLNFKIIRLTPVPGNDSGLIFNNALVLINANVLKSVGTAGV